jgi:CarD family transcriptional regulator
MVEQNMAFQVGDQVIHWVHGPGEIVQLDEKKLSGHTNQYYVVQMPNLMLWVPTTETGEHSLRFITQANEFQKIFDVIASPGEELSDDRFERKTLLLERLRDGTLESICRVVRDLTYRKRAKRMNEEDNTALNRAKTSLLNEWSLSLSIPIHQAEQELKELLGGL